MFFATFDYIIVILIFIFNIVVWKYNIINKSHWILYLVVFVIFGVIIPYFSVDFGRQVHPPDQSVAEPDGIKGGCQ